MRRILSTFTRPKATLATARRRHAVTPQHMTKDEYEYLQKELPPRELLRQVRTKDKEPSSVDNEEQMVPGDSFGIMQNRTVFQKPVARPVYGPDLAVHFPEGLPPVDYIHPAILRRLCGQYALSVDYAVGLFREVEGDMNVLVQTLLERKKIPSAPFGAFSVVAMESYVPENFCFVNFTLPSFEASRDEQVLEAIHELILSAAELPIDLPPAQLLPKFMDWTVESGERCDEVMASFDISATAVQLLAHGEYSAQGFTVLKPLDELGFPNIGCGAAACCLDLRTGIHNRFRFHVERLADSVSEHVLREQVHFGQDDHILRQKFWFNPEYSVEEQIRYKENLLQPSATIYEMRYGVMLSSSYGLKPFRNIVEMEKLKIAQHKYDKHHEDLPTMGSRFTADGANLQTTATAGGGVSGSTMHRESNAQKDKDTGLRTNTAPITDMMATTMQRHGDYALRRFYRNNFH
jgi:hypothetical protein